MTKCKECHYLWGGCFSPFSTAPWESHRQMRGQLSGFIMWGHLPPWNCSQMLDWTWGSLRETITRPVFSSLRETRGALVVLSSILPCEVKVPQSCPILCYLMDCTVCGILQARTLEWVAVPFSRGSSQCRDRTQISHNTGRFFTSWATREAHFTM